MFRVADEQMLPVTAHVGDDPGATPELLAALVDNAPPLTHLLAETEALRRRIPLLVPDAVNDPRVHPALVSAWGTSAYVAAPLMSAGDVIGFLHADRDGQDREVDAFDRDALWAFAEGVGFAYAGVVLSERLRAQRSQVRGLLSSTEALIEELIVAEIEADRLEPDEAQRAAEGAASLLSGGPSRLEQLLTPREIDVMQLLAAGETNAGVAARLVISEGTVKSHVKHILRKLRAANRAEAVSRYLRITALDRSSS